MTERLYQNWHEVRFIKDDTLRLKLACAKPEEIPQLAKEYPNCFRTWPIERIPLSEIWKQTLRCSMLTDYHEDMITWDKPDLEMVEGLNVLESFGIPCYQYYTGEKRLKETEYREAPKSIARLIEPVRQGEVSSIVFEGCEIILLRSMHEEEFTLIPALCIDLDT